MTYMAECGQREEPEPREIPSSVQHQSGNLSNNFQEQSLPPPSPCPQAQCFPLPAKSEMEAEVGDNSGAAPVPAATEAGEEARPYWMKVKKISNKERRRRQNEHLRRLLTPKNAVMVINEMLPKEQVTHVNPVQQGYCASINIDGVEYKGIGENKTSARNAAAELAIRDIMIKKMNKLASHEGTPRPAPELSGEDDSLPMIQLTSFALHKLFTEWECAGLKVPQLRPPAPTNPEAECEETDAGGDASDAESAPVGGKRSKGASTKPKKVKVLPLNATVMHPCMLLTYMRPALEYHDVAAEGDRPQNMLFTVGLDVDGVTYHGKASNKREARKTAARAACLALFGIQVEPDASETVPAF